VKTIGLTGGIGSGKSTVARLLSDLGAEIIDADRVGHSVYAPGTEGWERVVAAFGRDIVAPDGSIDRKRLGALVFADRSQLARLNAIVHPLIGQAIQRHIAVRRRAGSATPIVVEAAVLIEAQWQSLVDEVWLVVARRDTLLARLLAQRNLDRAEIEARIASQLGDDERRRHAQIVIENDGSADELQRQIEKLWVERCTETKPG
jgi:dephospho-CoA kinase